MRNHRDAAFIKQLQSKLVRCLGDGVAKSKLKFAQDKRRKHHHWLVTVSYADSEQFGRVYTDVDKAKNFATRQKKSPIVKKVQVRQIS